MGERFRYYWDSELFEALLRYRMRPFLAEIIAHGGGELMGQPTDIKKLMQRVQRGNTLLDQAAKDGDAADGIMDQFQQSMGRFNAHFGGVKEYTAQLDSMLTAMGGNGGPPLDATFQSTSASSGTGTATVASVTHPIDNATGDRLKT